MKTSLYLQLLVDRGNCSSQNYSSAALRDYDAMWVKKCLHARTLLIVKTSLNLQLRHQQIVVAAGIIAAAMRLLRWLRDYEMGVNLRFTYWKDITLFIIYKDVDTWHICREKCMLCIAELQLKTNAKYLLMSWGKKACIALWSWNRSDIPDIPPHLLKNL